MRAFQIHTYHAAVGGGLPPEGKFVRLQWQAATHLLFAPPERCTYHNQIVAQFLEDRALEHDWLSPDRLEIHAPGIVVQGGGRFRADAGRATLELWDRSTAYGRFAAEGLAAGIRAAGHAWSDYRVIIR